MSSEPPTETHSKIQVAEPTSIRRAAEFLLQGDLVGLPTETVYGLAARGDDEMAVAKIFAAKNRPAGNPLILHVASYEDALSWFESDLSPIVQNRLRCLSVFWPGPLTVVGPRSRQIPINVTASGSSVAIRVPDHNVALAVIQRCKEFAGRCVPIAAPSANVSNYVSPTTAMHVAEGLASRVAMILDGGACRVGLESTIVDLGDAQTSLRILRSGQITKEQIERETGERVDQPSITSSEDEPVTAPGQFAKHYSPRLPVILLDQSHVARMIPPANNVLRITFERIDPDWPDNIWTFTSHGDLTEAAAGLYAVLRRADARDYDRIEIMSCPAVGIGEAIMDRLRRATGS